MTQVAPNKRVRKIAGCGFQEKQWISIKPLTWAHFSLRIRRRRGEEGAGESYGVWTVAALNMPNIRESEKAQGEVPVSPPRARCALAFQNGPSLFWRFGLDHRSSAS